MAESIACFDTTRNAGQCRTDALPPGARIMFKINHTFNSLLISRCWKMFSTAKAEIELMMAVAASNTEHEPRRLRLAAAKRKFPSAFFESLTGASRSRSEKTDCRQHIGRRNLEDRSNPLAVPRQAVRLSRYLSYYQLSPPIKFNWTGQGEMKNN